jgi:hypothetical protein
MLDGIASLACPPLVYSAVASLDILGLGNFY